MQWIEGWMNNPAIKTALGVDPSKHFASCNMEVNQAFTLNGDGMHNSALLLPELVDAGVRLLVYAGNAGEFFRSSPSLFICSAPCGAAYKSSYLPRLLFPQVCSILSFTSSDVVVTVTRCMVGLRVAGRSARLSVTGARIIYQCYMVHPACRLPRLFVGGRTTRSLFSEHVFRCTERRGMVVTTTELKSCNTQTISFSRAALFRLNSALNILTDDNTLLLDMMCNYMARSFRVCYFLVINDSYRVMNAGSENYRASSWRNSSNQRRSLGKQQRPDTPPVNLGAQAGTATPPATSLS